MRLDSVRRIGLLAAWCWAALFVAGHAGPRAEGQDPTRRPSEVLPTGERPRRARRFERAALTVTYEAAPAAPAVKEEEVEGADDEEEHPQVSPPPPRPRAVPGLQVALPPGRTAAPGLAAGNFDRWVFGNMETDRQRRDWLGTLLEERIGGLPAGPGFTAAERSKLRQAGLGDVKRFMERAEEARREFEQVRGNQSSGISFLHWHSDLTESFGTGPFGEGSLYAKTLRSSERKRAEEARD